MKVHRGAVDFVLNLYKELIKDGGNVLISPHHISVLLSVVSLGAEGRTLDQIVTVLGFESAHELQKYHVTLEDELIAKMRCNLLMVDNFTKILLTTKYLVSLHFESQVANLFGLPIERLDLGDSPKSKVMEWLDDKNGGGHGWPTTPPNRRTGAHDLSELGSGLLLLNAVTLKGEWEDAFHPSSNTKRPFYTSPDDDAIRQVTMMSRIGYYNVFVDAKLETTAIEIPYSEGELSVLILLPQERDGLQQVEAKLTSKILIKLMSKTMQARIRLTLPKTELEFGRELSGDLSVLGVSSAFNYASSDLNKISPKPGLCLSKFVHKTFIRFGEEGSDVKDTGDAGEVDIKYQQSSNSHSKTLELVCDHPFMFIIKVNSSNNILFIGRVTEL